MSAFVCAFSEKEYLSAVNEQLLESLGEPESSEGWRAYQPPQRQKFIRWRYLRDMRRYFDLNEKKLGVVAGYLTHIKGVRTEGNPDNIILIVDFGEFAVLDDESETDFSYLCDKFALGKILEEKNIETEGKKLADARSFILEEADDDLIRLNFFSVGKLYIQETLNILLGITPDTRSSKNIIAAKLKKEREQITIGI